MPWDSCWSLPVTEFAVLLDVAARRSEQRSRDAWVRAAFVGWQILSALTPKPPTFAQYLKRLGLEAESGRGKDPSRHRW